MVIRTRMLATTALYCYHCFLCECIFVLNDRLHVWMINKIKLKIELRSTHSSEHGLELFQESEEQVCWRAMLYISFKSVNVPCMPIE